MGDALIWLDNAATTQKPQAVIDRLAALLRARELERPSRRPHAGRARHRRLRGRARQGARASSTPRRRRRSCSSAARPRPSTSSRRAGAAATSRRATRSSSPGSSITPTSCPGSSSAPRRARGCASPRSTTAARFCSTSTRSCSARAPASSRCTQVSNALGTVTPAREMVEMAHRHGALALVDGAQSVSHRRADVQALDADFFVFSGHKMFAPTGIGALYGKQAILDDDAALAGRRQHDRRRDLRADGLPARRPTASRPAPATSPTRSASARRSTTSTRSGSRTIAAHEHELIEHTVAGLRTIPGLRLIGTAAREGGRRLVRARRLPNRRCRQGARPGGHCGPRGPPLRPADPAPLRARKHGAAVVRALQHRAKTSRRSSPPCGGSRCRPRAARAEGRAGAQRRPACRRASARANSEFPASREFLRGPVCASRRNPTRCHRPSRSAIRRLRDRRPRKQGIAGVLNREFSACLTAEQGNNRERELSLRSRPVQVASPRPPALRIRGKGDRRRQHPTGGGPPVHYTHLHGAKRMTLGLKPAYCL